MTAAQPEQVKWTYDRMGQECARNATIYSKQRPRPTMNDIVKYAYETTMQTMVDEYEAEIATLQQQLQQASAGEWQPLPDGEYKGQHRGHSMTVEGEWLKITETTLPNREVVEAELAVHDEIRLCRRTAAVASEEMSKRELWQPAKSGLYRWENSVGDDDIIIKIEEDGHRISQWNASDPEHVDEIALGSSSRHFAICEKVSVDDPDDGGGVSLSAATVAALRVLVYGESYCGPDAPTMEDAHRLIKQLLADVAQDKGGTGDE